MRLLDVTHRVTSLLRRRAADRAADASPGDQPNDRAHREQLQVIVSLLDQQQVDEARAVALQGPWTPRPGGRR